MKVNVGNAKTDKKYLHDRSHDVSTTSDFGFMQPLMVDEVIGNSTCELRTGQIVQMMNLSKPTFGTMYLKTYHVFVPMESIYHPYASLRAGQTYMGANSTYIPQQVMSLNTALLSYICKLMSDIVIFKLDGNEFISSYNIQFSTTNATYISSWQNVFVQWAEDCEKYITNSNVPFYLYNNNDFVNFTRYLSVYDKDTNGDPIFDGYDWIDTFQIVPQGGNAENYVIAGKYHDSALNFRKVCYGCGYKLLWDNTQVSALPLFAYWKVYYDLFYPQRDLTWKDTAAAGIQEWCEQYGRFIFTAGSTGLVYQKLGLLVQFVKDICTAYYTKSPDFVSSHITGQRISTVPNTNISVIDAYSGNLDKVGTLSNPNSGVGIGTNVSTAGNVSYLASINNGLLNQSALDLLQRVYHRINAHTAIGGDIRTYLKSQLGIDYLDEDETYWIGATSVPISADPVVSQAETPQGFLGELSAFGRAGDGNKSFKYSCDVPGYWVCLATVVPEARFAQGMDMSLKHLKKDDFFDANYDSQTLLPTEKKYIFAESQFDNLVTPADFSSSFGNIPNYFEYCVKQNLINGDMSLRSTRATYLPFNLDILLPYTDSTYFNNTQETVCFVDSLNPTYLVNGTIWRYIGLYKWIGGFDRIFRVSGDGDKPWNAFPTTYGIFASRSISDNFLIHNYMDYKVWSTKLPCRDAFQTGAFDSDSFAIEKA